MLGAGRRGTAARGDTDEARHILIAVARYLAAHSPTERAALQTADIARRLMRGGELHQEAGASCRRDPPFNAPPRSVASLGYCTRIELDPGNCSTQRAPISMLGV